MELKTTLCNALSISVYMCPEAPLSLSLPLQEIHRQTLNLALSCQGLTGLKLSLDKLTLLLFLVPTHLILIVGCSLGLFLAFVFSHECT